MLHPQAKKRLLEELKKALPSLAIRHGLFLESFIAFLALHKAEEVIPKTGKLRVVYEEWIDDTPVTTFVGGRPREELRHESKYESRDQLKKLGAHEELKDRKEVGGGKRGEVQ